MKQWHAARERMTQPRPTKDETRPDPDLDDGLTVLGRRMDTAGVIEETDRMYEEAFQRVDTCAAGTIRLLAVDKMADFETWLKFALEAHWKAREATEFQARILKLTTDEEVTKAMLGWKLDAQARDAWVAERIAALKAWCSPWRE